MRKFNLVYIPTVIIALCVIGGAVHFFVNSDSKPNISVQVEQKKSAPSFELKDAQGNIHRLTDWKNELVVLHFWATWCPPCLDEIPQWVELGTYFKDKKVKLVAVSLDSTWDDAHKILPSKSLSSNIISLLDPEHQVPETYGSYQYPETYLIGPDQKILMKWVGPQDWSSENIRKFIEDKI